MRKKSIVLFVALASAAAVAVAYGGGAGSSAASTSPARSGQDTQAAAGPGAVDTSQPLPPNHPALHGGAVGASPQDFQGLEPTGAGNEEAPPELAWKAPDGWVPVPNPNPMRLATYKLPRAGSDKEDTELVVARAGGDVEANVERWGAQFAGASTPKETKKTVHALKVTLVDVAGTYQGGMGPSTAPHPGWAMLGAIVEARGPTGESYFFKVIGPAATVHAAQKAFEAMIDGITPVK